MNTYKRFSKSISQNLLGKTNKVIDIMVITIRYEKLCTLEKNLPVARYSTENSRHGLHDCEINLCFLYYIQLNPDDFLKPQEVFLIENLLHKT